MTDERLRQLAHAAGVAASWKDVFGKVHEVAPPSLRAVLKALELPADSDAELADSLHRATSSASVLPPLVTAQVGLPVDLPGLPLRYSLTLEDGRMFDGYAEPHGDGARIPPILEAGYHQLELGGQSTVVAVAPRQCFTVPEAIGTAKGWGLAVQLYALRRPGDAGLGDFAALAALAGPAARHGAQAIAISPVHAQFSADTNRFSPYAPSSRTALNVLHAEIDGGDAALEALDLVDWPASSAFRLARLREMFTRAQADPAEQQAMQDFAARQGERLRLHAIFEALHAHFLKLDPACWHWRSWPAAMQDPHGEAVQAFARANAAEIGFHAWLQFRADRGLARAQSACRDAGMGIGLISDLAVGTDSGGSQCWSRQQETLLGLTVGAPPDLLQRAGQNWGLTAFSPRGLTAAGFGTYREMLAAALAHAGGMRIDHAMGLNRLWVIPEGGTGADGAYLSFPERDLLRLITLESRLHRAIVLAEDLGTVPEGFQDRLRDAGIDGMRVLWFERDQQQNFVPPAHWTPRAAAMTSTHDLSTVAGWWQGRDIAWRERLGQLSDVPAAQAERAAERTQIWQAMRDSGAAEGEPPGKDDTGKFADAACAHVGRSACELVMLPIEDALALEEQPNLPGTLDEHPNWRRRLPGDAGHLLDAPDVAGRLALLNRSRLG
jgi:4-alpha-glucanotransferase